jgi:hypothetical protein
VVDLSERALSGLEGIASNLQVGLWLPLDFPFTAKGNYRVITFWHRFQGVKVKYSLGKNDRDSYLIPEGRLRFGHKSWSYNLP